MLLVQTRISLEITFILLHDIDSDLQVKMKWNKRGHVNKVDVQIFYFVSLSIKFYLNILICKRLKLQKNTK